MNLDDFNRKAEYLTKFRAAIESLERINFGRGVTVKAKVFDDLTAVITLTLNDRKVTLNTQPIRFSLLTYTWEKLIAACGVEIGKLYETLWNKLGAAHIVPHTGGSVEVVEHTWDEEVKRR